MSYFKRQYTRMQDHFLKRKIGQSVVTRHPADFASAKKIGILFNATDPVQRRIVVKYATELRKSKQVQLLAFLNAKKEDGNFPFKHFTLKQLNFFRHPSGVVVKDFIYEPFDILLNLFLDEEPALEYIAALSHAHLRVGPYTKHTYCYDLMIDTAQRQDLNEFIKQAELLLNKVNKQPHETTSA